MTRYFAYKAWLGGAGLVTGLFGMALGHRWLVWVAVAFLAVAFTLRFAERKAHNS
jgi:membrane protein implicated in regulation of membrane protease activity